MEENQIVFHMGCPRLGTRWGFPKLAPDGVPKTGSQIEVPQIGSQMEHPTLAPSWGAPDWLEYGVLHGVPHISSQIGHPSLDHRWGTPDWIPDGASQKHIVKMGVWQVGTQMRVPQISCQMEKPILTPTRGTQIGSHNGLPILTPRWFASELALKWGTTDGGA